MKETRRSQRRAQGGSGSGKRTVGWLGGLAVLGFIYVGTQRAQAAPFTSSSSSPANLEARSSRAPSDIVDQLFDSLASHFAHSAAAHEEQRLEEDNDRNAYWPVSPPPQWERSQHPLPRRGLEERQAAAAAAPQSFAPAVALAATGDEVDSSATTTGVPTSMWDDDDHDGEPSLATAVAAAEAPSASAASGATVAVARVGAAVTASAESAAASETPTAASASSAASPSSASGSATPSPSASSQSASQPAPSSTPPPASSSSKPLASMASQSKRPVPTTKPDEKQEQTEAEPSILSPKNKIFPLVVVGISAAVILALLLFIALARAVAHDKMRRDAITAAKREGYTPEEAYKDKGGDHRLTSAAPGMSAARSIRRAITRKKLGSFQRRTQDDSVLIDVGDEVFAVPAHLAESYRNELIRERRLGSSSNGSKESISDGPFGRIKPKHLTGGGPDVEGWRAKMDYDEQVNGTGSGGAGGRNDTSKPSRTLSQRIADRFKSITQPLWEEDEGGRARSTRPPAAFSFDAADQPRGAMRQADLSSHLPVLTHGSNDWQIRPSNAANGQQQARTPANKPRTSVPRKPVSYPDTTNRKSTAADASILSDKLSDLEKQVHHSSNDRRRRHASSGASGLPPASELSHERVTLSDGPSPSSSSLGHETGMGTYAGSSDLHSSRGHGDTTSSGYTGSNSSATAAAGHRDPAAIASSGKDGSTSTAPAPRAVEFGRVEIKQGPQRAKSIHPVAAATASSGAYRHRKAQQPSHQQIADRVNNSQQQQRHMARGGGVAPTVAPTSNLAAAAAAGAAAATPAKMTTTTTAAAARSKSQHAAAAATTGYGATVDAARTPAGVQRNHTTAAVTPKLQRGQSTAAASPELYRSRRFTGPGADGKPVLTLRPAQPPRAAFLNPSGGGSGDPARPLPMPPRFAP